MSDVEETHEKQPLLDEREILSTNGSLKVPCDERNAATQQGTGLKIETHYKPKVCSLLLIIIIIIIIIINPLTTRVVGVPQMILQPVFSIFPCSPLPSRTWRTPGPSIP